MSSVERLDVNGQEAARRHPQPQPQQQHCNNVGGNSAYLLAPAKLRPHCFPINMCPPPPSLILQSYQYLPPLPTHTEQQSQQLQQAMLSISPSPSPSPSSPSPSRKRPHSSSSPSPDSINKSVNLHRPKKCFKWTDELEMKFQRAMNKYGCGAKPAQIQKEMGVPHLSRSQISSHLQKYRTAIANESGSATYVAMPMEVIMKREILGFDVNHEDFILSMVDLVDLIQERWGTVLDDGSSWQFTSY